MTARTPISLLPKTCRKPILASTILALAVGAGLWTPGSASGAINGNCPAFKEPPSLPCSASEGQTKRPATKPDGTILTNSKIAWRVVAPNARIAN